MKTVLICPVERPAIAEMLAGKPVALLPVLGKAFIEHWLEQLAILGAREVTVLAADRPGQIRAFVGDGARWGLHIEVLPEMREVSVEEARAKYLQGATGEYLPRPNDVILADHLPGLAKFQMLESYAAWYQTMLGMLQRRAFPNYIGLREIQPNVWAGRCARIAKTAVIKAPCWIGEHAFVGEGAQVGPMAIIENGAFVDLKATVASSIVGPNTYAGPNTEIEQCIALGSNLINWKTGSSVVTPARFLLCALTAPRVKPLAATLLARMGALFAMILTLPIASCIVLRSWLAGQPAFRVRNAVPPDSRNSANARSILYYELLHTNCFWKRWPQLWNVLEGDFSWVGNRPLTGIQAGRLSNDFERMWLATSIGVFSLADAEGCMDVSDDEARAHASFYAAQARPSLRFSILQKVFARAIHPAPRHGEPFTMPIVAPVVNHQGQA